MMPLTYQNIDCMAILYQSKSKISGCMRMLLFKIVLLYKCMIFIEQFSSLVQRRARRSCTFLLCLILCQKSEFINEILCTSFDPCSTWNTQMLTSYILCLSCIGSYTVNCLHLKLYYMNKCLSMWKKQRLTYIKWFGRQIDVFLC